ncbi:MAG: ATP/GTP-binding protein [Thiotrichaceae bacterium]
MRYKIIITGPVGAGKTTAINSLTDQKALKTDAPVSDMTTSQRKKTTTVALDYGVIKLSEDDVAHVYGTPGQERFDFMWEIISEGAHGLVLLLDNSRNYPFRDLIYYTNQFRDLIDGVPFIIGVTRSDIKNDPDIETYIGWVKEQNLDAEVVMVDARNKEHIHQLVSKLVDKAADSDSKDDVGKVAVVNPVVVDSVIEVQAEVMPDEGEVIPAVTSTPEQSSSKIMLTEKSMAAVAKINGVTGVSLANDMGELIDSTVLDEDLNEFIAFLSGITPSIQDAANLGEIHRIMLRGTNDDNLTVFVEDERSLGVTSLHKTSVPALSQQIEDMLQWI